MEELLAVHLSGTGIRRIAYSIRIPKGVLTGTDTIR
jgi:hypothetical protein